MVIILRKNIWILNHYATNMFQDEGGRHYWFAENLIKLGYNPIIFCASTIHNSDKSIEIGNKKYCEKSVNGIKFVFIKTPQYVGNSKKRIFNMISFYRNIVSVSRSYESEFGNPDIILASSVHPLTLLAGLKISKRFKVPCICEIRDLWPESIVAYGVLKRDNILVKVLYLMEKMIYKKADAIVMTWEGGKDYIIDRKWEESINLDKVTHISNGILLEQFNENVKNFILEDSDLDNPNFKNIVYAGSIRKVNNLGVVLDTAKVIQSKRDDIRFLIYGMGDELELLKKRCKDENIKNVIFKGRIKKKYIPSLLTQADINLLHNQSTTLNKYGQSQNKFFEYLAAGKCIIQTYTTRYSVLEQYNCGLMVERQEPELIAEKIIYACNNDLEEFGNNSKSIAEKYDFKKLTEKLVAVIENIEEERL